MILHPRFSTLVEYVHHGLSVKQRARVSSHLLNCPDCNATVDSIDHIRRLGADAYSAKPRPDTMVTVRQMWQAGERVILPDPDVTVSRTHYRRFMVAAAAITAIVAAGVTFGISEARGNRSELRFNPPAPQPGDTVEVEYLSTGWLGSEERLYLRARYRSALDVQRNRGARQVKVAELVKRGRGRYRGTIALPDSAVYSVFAVEDSGARRVDSNGRRFWELLEHQHGRPTRNALLQKQYDLMGVNWELAYATARVATELHPEDPFLWYSRQAFETALFGSFRRDSLRDVHRARFDELHSMFFNTVDLTGDQLSGMYWLGYGSVVADSAQVEYWRQRLITEAPNHPFAVQERAFDVIRRSSEIADGLQSFDSLWHDIGPSHARLARIGLDRAFQVRDETSMLTWLDRREALEPWSALNNSLRLLEIPAMRERALVRLRAELGRLTTQSRSVRDLDQTMREWEHESAARRRTILTAIGRGLVASDRVLEGLDTLRLAAEEGWDAGVFLNIAGIKMDLGDTLGALDMFSRVVVDPKTSRTVTDSLNLIGSRMIGVDTWTDAVRDAREMMYGRTLRMATDRRVSLRLRLDRSNGSGTTMLEEALNKVTVVAFWSRYCGPSVNQLMELQSVAQRLETQGVSVLAITEEEPSQDLADFLTKELTDLPVYHDSRGAARAALNSWGTPQYFVIDAKGRLRFERVQLADVERYAAALAIIR